MFLFSLQNSWEYFSTATVKRVMQFALTGITSVSVIVTLNISCTMDIVLKVLSRTEPIFKLNKFLAKYFE